MRRSLTYRSLPVWVQWVLPFAVAIVLIVALVVFVHHETDDVSQIASVNSHSAIVEQNREDTIIVRQQQAPHVFKLNTAVSARVNARRAVVLYMRGQIDHGVMDGPIKSAGCKTIGGTTSRLVLHCDVVASVVKYPFDVVVAPSAGSLTYCQRVAPPLPTMNIPVSKRCT
jgi:hypothetical protein